MTESESKIVEAIRTASKYHTKYNALSDKHQNIISLLSVIDSLEEERDSESKWAKEYMDQSIKLGAKAESLGVKVEGLEAENKELKGKAIQSQNTVKQLDIEISNSMHKLIETQKFSNKLVEKLKQAEDGLEIIASNKTGSDTDNLALTFGAIHANLVLKQIRGEPSSE